MGTISKKQYGTGTNDGGPGNSNSSYYISAKTISNDLGLPLSTQVDLRTIAILTNFKTEAQLTLGSKQNVSMLDFDGKSFALSATSISVSPSSTSFSNTGGTRDITVTSNGSFLLSNVPEWLFFVPSFGRSSTTLTLYASNNANLGNPDKTATVEFVGLSGITRATLSVSLAGNPATTTISPSTNQSVTNTSGTSNIIVTLSNGISITGASISNTTGFSLSGPSTSVGASTTNYTYTLSRTTNTGNSRSTTFTVNYEKVDVGFSGTKSVTYTQAEAATFTSSDITVTGFDVDSAGTITAPTVTTAGTSVTITYTTASNSGTAYVPPAKFPLVSSNTTRYCNVTVTVPAGYLNVGDRVTRTVSATQELVRNFVGTDISITGFDVDLNGTITAPNVSPAASAIVYSTATDGGGTTVTPPAKFALVTSNTTRFCKVSVTVPSGYFNVGATVSRTVSATQELIPTFTSANISITGFDVDADGNISTVTVTPTASSIVYSTATGGGGTTVIPPAKFALVGVNTTRYVTANVTVPSGYFNTGASVSRTVTAIQEEKFYGTDEMSIGVWSVSEFGVITPPSVSATGVTAGNITITYSGGVLVTKGYPQSLGSVVRTATASVTVPSGWFNSGETQSVSRTTTQPATELTGWLYYPANTTTQRPNWNVGGINGSLTGTGFWGETETDTRYLTFSLRTNVQVLYSVQQFTSGVTIVQPLNDSLLIDNEFTTTLETDTPTVSANTSFRLKVNAPSAGSSVFTTLYFETDETVGKNFEIQLTLTRTSSSGTVDTGTVDTGTVRPRPEV